MATDRARQRVGRFVQERRERYLKIGKEEAARRVGMNSITWRRVEDGRPVKGETLARMDEALRLPPGTLAEKLEEEEDEPVDPIVAEILADDRLTDDDKRDIIAAHQDEMALHHERIARMRERRATDRTA